MKNAFSFYRRPYNITIQSIMLAAMITAEGNCASLMSRMAATCLGWAEISGNKCLGVCVKQRYLCITRAETGQCKKSAELESFMGSAAGGTHILYPSIKLTKGCPLSLLHQLGL